MLPKKNRADKKTIEKVFKEGKFLNSTNLTFKYFTNTQKGKKISFIVPKSVAKKAVDRNRLRRLGYLALKQYINTLPQYINGAFIFKKKEDNISILQNEIQTIFSKIN